MPHMTHDLRLGTARTAGCAREEKGGKVRGLRMLQDDGVEGWVDGGGSCRVIHTNTLGVRSSERLLRRPGSSVLKRCVAEVAPVRGGGYVKDTR